MERNYSIVGASEIPRIRFIDGPAEIRGKGESA
jgi:hypothetical protein